MIKRANKLTALLVAATSVAAIAPMTSAHAATKLETLDGTIEGAQAYKDGKYIFEGYKGDAQDNSIYFSNGNKDTEIDDVDYFNHTIFNQNTINFTDDDVLFNLTTGKEEDDDAEGVLAVLNAKFNSTIFKKVDRYDGNNNGYQIDDKNPIYAGQFSDVWYNYYVTTSGAATNQTTAAYNGFINQAGTKYVDASHTMNITHYYETKDANGNTVWNHKTFDTKGDAEKAGYTVTEKPALFADEDYIYRFVTLSKDNNETTYLQKISKAQGDTEDDAYLPKSVTSYLLRTDSDGNSDPEDVKKALKVDNNKLNETNTKVRVVNGSLYSIHYDGNELSVVKYDLKKTRDEDDDLSDRINRVSEDDDFSFSTSKVKAYDIDVNGNVWVLHNGKVKKLVGDELTDVYTTDRSMNEISVYDDNNMVIWNTEDDIYSTVAGTDSSDDEDNNDDNNNSNQVVAGWVEGSNGTWSYNNADGTKVTGWFQSPYSGKWFFMNQDGVMQTGWVQSPYSGKWYYMGSDGAMQTGWVQSPYSGKWFYMGSDGAMQTGWIQSPYSGKWYYMGSDGAMVTNTTVNGYVLGSDGAWIR